MLQWCDGGLQTPAGVESCAALLHPLGYVPRLPTGLCASGLFLRLPAKTLERRLYPTLKGLSFVHLDNWHVPCYSGGQCLIFAAMVNP